MGSNPAFFLLILSSKSAECNVSHTKAYWHVHLRVLQPVTGGAKREESWKAIEMNVSLLYPSSAICGQTQI